jgi:argininosuccinate lyase
MKLWEKGGRNGGRPQSVCAFTAGEDHVLDRRLVKYDCLASMAHARALRKSGLLSGRDLNRLVTELRHIIALDAAGKFRIKPDEEDCHTAIENFLERRLGDAGKRIHAGRSRNDQVAAALRLYYRDELASVIRLASSLRSDIGGFSRRHGRVPMPGYTHTRKAMPSSVGVWAGSSLDSLCDSLRMLALAAELFDQNPLGSAAGYGSPLRLDQKRVARELGFASAQENPLYVQNGRGKLEGFMLHALSQVMLDLNKMATDIILFTTAEFGYFTLPDELCTGSSIMPQKKNPDVLELVRAKYHVVSSLECRVMGISGNLISGYNRDLQLTKGAVMEAFDTVKACLSMMSQVVKGLGVDGARCRSAMTEELFAAGKAIELARKGVPFRDAYRELGRKYA